MIEKYKKEEEHVIKEKTEKTTAHSANSSV
jgi:hypothetical protein